MFRNELDEGDETIGGGGSNKDRIPFEQTDFMEIILRRNGEICRNFRKKTVYFTSTPDLKDKVSSIMDRGSKFLKYGCDRVNSGSDYNKTPIGKAE